MASSEANSGWSKTLHDLRGTGSGLRIWLDSDKLEKHGWSVVSRDFGNKRLLTFIDPEGRRQKCQRSRTKAGFWRNFTSFSERWNYQQNDRRDRDCNCKADRQTFGRPLLWATIEAKNSFGWSEIWVSNESQIWSLFKSIYYRARAVSVFVVYSCRL